MASSSQNTQAQTTSNTKYNQATSPWAPQASQIQNVFNNADKAYGLASDATLPPDFVASMTPQQLDIFRQMVGSGTGATGIGSNIAMAGGTTAPAAYNNAESALTNLSGYDPSQTNNAGNVMDIAKQYVQGVDIPAQVKAAMQGATEQARDVTIPGLYNNAASTGNVDSSRTSIQDGLVQRALAEQSGNLGATLSNEAWNTGTNLGEGLLSGNNTQRLAAMTAALSGGTGLGTSGTLAGQSGINDLLNGWNIAGSGAAGPQQNQQLQLQNALQKYMYGVQAPFTPTNELANLVMNGNWGSNITGQSNTNGTSNSTTTSNPSAFQIIAGLMGAGGSMMSGLGGQGLGWTPLKAA